MSMRNLVLHRNSYKVPYQIYLHVLVTLQYLFTFWEVFAEKRSQGWLFKTVVPTNWDSFS